MERGIVAALVTPLNENETVDQPSLTQLVDRVIKGGVAGVFVGGTIGEGAALRDVQRSPKSKGARTLKSMPLNRLQISGRRDSNPRHPAWEAGGTLF